MKDEKPNKNLTDCKKKAAGESDRIKNCSILSHMGIMFSKMEEVSLGSHAEKNEK